ncbi:MAG: hypothetical protein Q9160_003082 [Pyrenula sp. 1 TL-2023]
MALEKPQLTTPLSLHTHLLTLLRALIHHILYLRRIYPRDSFTPVRTYNHPTQQSRHPAVTSWITSAISAAGQQLRKNVLQTISIVIFAVDSNTVYERYVVDLSDLPVVEDWRRDAESEFASDKELSPATLADLSAQFRALLTRVDTMCARMKPLPTDEESTFTVCMEVKDEADRPVGRLDPAERVWVAAESEAEKMGKMKAIRRVEVGELRMEMWIEEATGKPKDTG